VPESVAYIQRPAWAKWLQRAIYVLAYGLFGVAGWAAVGTLGFPARETGYLAMAASALAIVGVVTRLYQLELIALWPLITSMAIWVVWLVIPPQSAVLTGWLVAAYIPFLAARLLNLNLIARKAREEVAP
jgi:hypothetical protein